ncbi:MAG: peptidylprolyl isomerase PrsA [Streptococcus sp.]|nr:peptidylprolyl isomerase PrsA [Streptococcus sp.]
MKKKLLMGAVTLLSVVTLAACSQSGGKDIITMKGNTITVNDFYNEVKTNTTAQQVLLQMTIKKAFGDKYGKKITDKKVNEEFNKAKEGYGSAFQQILAQNGMTEENYKEQIRTQLLVEYATKTAAEKEVTNETYKAAFEKYTPEVTAQIIKLDSEDKAKEVLEQVKAEGADFTQIAKDNSTDTATKEKGGEIKFDSGSTDVADTIKSAAFALNENAISDVVTVQDGYSSSYYIVKLVKKSEKSSNWKDYKARLKEIIIAEKQSDTNFIYSVISNVLKEANIKVKDSAFQSLFSQYINSSASSSTSSSSSTSKETSSSAAESSSSEASSSAE